ncbi:MAG: hypothetical protein ABR562_03135 [Thermoplasmatota archaeon]
MRTATKWTLAAVVMLGLVGVVAVTAAGHGKGPAAGPLAVFKVCTDDSMTVGQCKELVKEKMREHMDQMYQKCLESHDKASCDQQRAHAEERMAHDGQ